MDLSIIIVSWNNREILGECLKSIYQYTQNLDFEVLVSDNGSTDGTLELIKEDFPQVKFIANNNNLGFARANNLAYHQATGRYILFLNDDTEIKSNIFKTLVDQYPFPAGLLGCRLLNLDGSLQKSVRHFPTLKDQLIILTKTHNFFPGLIKKYLAQDFDYSKTQEVDQVMGAFMLSPKKILDQVGIFDEKFFCWFEEVDLQKRIKQAGYPIIYTPLVQCYHAKGASFGKILPVANQKILNASLRHYFHKHHPYWQYLLIVLAQPLSLFLAWLIQTFKINVRKYKPQNL